MKGSQAKLMFLLILAVLFFVVSSPQLYKFTNKLAGSSMSLADAKGCPTTTGLVVHSVIFVLLFWLVMKLLKNQA